MTESAIVHATFVIEKTYPKPLAQVFAAFSDPVLKQRWFMPPGQQDGQGFTVDFRIGGSDHMHWTMGPETPFPGAVLSSETLYLDIVENSRIVSGSNMAMNGVPFSGSLLSFEFFPEKVGADGDGTRLTCTHQGAFFGATDGPAMRENGWKKLLEQLGEAL